MQVLPASPRFSVDHTPSGVRITIPSSRNWFSIIFLCAWLGGWYFGATSAIGELLNASDKTPAGFLSFWLTGWLLGGACAIAFVLWQLVGSETIEVNSTSLTRRLLIAGQGLSREYGSAHIASLRVSPLDGASAQAARWGSIPFGRTAGPVAFDYGARTIKFGGHLDEAEARGIVELLRAYLPAKQALQ